MKTIIARLTLLCGTCFCLSAFAQTNPDENPIEFSVIPDVANISCDGAQTNAVFTVINTDKYATIIVTPKEIINYDDFPDNLVTIQPKNTAGSLTTCDDTYLKPGKTCNINLIITPASCASSTLSGPIDRTLVVATGTQYKNPTANFKFAYSTLGPADDFAILGAQVYNNGSTSYVTGNIGHTGNSNITGPFVVTDGQLYSSPTDPAVLNANQGFLTTYDNFIEDIAGCRLISDIVAPLELQASYYCLTSNLGLGEVGISEPIILSGNGYFVFFVDDGKGNCFGASSAHGEQSGAPCNLHFHSETAFIFKNGASPDKLFFLTGSGDIEIESGVELKGAILSGQSISTSPNGPSPASVTDGHLWALDTITLYGDSVSILTH